MSEWAQMFLFLSSDYNDYDFSECFIVKIQIIYTKTTSPVVFTQKSSQQVKRYIIQSSCNVALSVNGQFGNT